MSQAGPPKKHLTLLRRSEQTGMISRGFSVRGTAALLLLGSVGAAWAFSPGGRLEERAESVEPYSQLVVEGEPQVVAPLLGSLLGEVALSSSDRELMSKAGAQRMVWRSKPVVEHAVQGMRDRAKFLRAIEEIEEQYLSQGAYPALPAGVAAGAMTYRTDGQSFTLGSGHRRYTTEHGFSFGTSPSAAQGFELAGMLRTAQAGWGPWRKPSTEFVGLRGVEDTQALESLAETVPTSRTAARILFPVDRSTCGYLFHKKDGKSLYQSGELSYDSALGIFSLKLFRATPATGQALEADRLEAEADSRDGTLVLVGDQGLLVDLGLATPAEGPVAGVVSLASPAVMPCSVSQAIDGLRLAALARHQESLTPGRFLASQEKESQAVMVGRMKLLDKMGQLHQLHLRGGRASDYDWVVGQVCPVSDESRAESFVESQAYSSGEGSSLGQVVKAGR